MARPARKKRGLEDAAIGLFAARGLTGTTIKDIARQAGGTEGALYRHYRSKEEMAWRLYCREVESFVAELEPILQREGGSLVERLRAGVKFIYEYYKKNPDRLAFVLFTGYQFPRQSLADEAIDPDGPVIRFLRRERKAGRIGGGDPKLLLSMVRGVVLEPILMHRHGRLKKHPHTVAADVAAAAAKILKGNQT
jgi:AcrR family transcriptional regulator